MADFEAGILKGTIKSYVSNEHDEFAFILPDDSGPVIFIHATTVWNFNIEITPKPGDRIKVAYFTVTEGRHAGGRRATEILDYEVVEPTPSQTRRGTLKWFNSERGFGFVAPEGGGKDVFIHRSVIEQSLGTEAVPPIDVTLEFEVGPDRCGRDQVIAFAIIESEPAEAANSSQPPKQVKAKKKRRNKRQYQNRDLSLIAAQ